jgi:ribosome biogenesis GTPase
MVELNFEVLSPLGLTPALAHRAASLSFPEGVQVNLSRVTEVHRESVRLHDGGRESGARPLPTARALVAGRRHGTCRG